MKQITFVPALAPVLVKTPTLNSQCFSNKYLFYKTMSISGCTVVDGFENIKNLLPVADTKGKI